MTGSLTKNLCSSLFVCAMVVAGTSTYAAPPVSNPMGMIVGYPPGGASDRGARIVAEQLHNKLDINVVVENKTGAGGRVAAQYVKGQNANKDILMLGNPAVMAVAPLVYQNLGYDAYADFKPVAMVSAYDFGVAVPADSPLNTLDDLIEWIKDNPKEFNVGVPATGSLPHFFGLMLSDRIGVDAQIIGYRGSAPVITDLIGGSLAVAIDTLDVLIRQHKGDRIRILATSGSERDGELPDVPTFTEEGIDLQASGWNALFAPAGMDDRKIQLLGNTIKDIMAQENVRQSLLQHDLVPVSANADETKEIIREFRKQWDPVIKDSGYVVDK